MADDSNVDDDNSTLTEEIEVKLHSVLLCSFHSEGGGDDGVDDNNNMMMMLMETIRKMKLTEEVEVELTLCVTLLYPRRLDMREGGRAFRVGAVLVVCLVISTIIIIIPYGL